MEYFLFAPSINCARFLNEQEQQSFKEEIKHNIPGTSVKFTFEMDKELRTNKQVQKMTVYFPNYMEHYDIEDAWAEILNALQENKYIF